MDISRTQFDQILAQFNTQPKEYSYEYSLTSLIYGDRPSLTLQAILQNMQLYAPEHPYFVPIVQRLVEL